VTETEWQDDHGFVRVQVTDPDGYRVELFAIGQTSASPVAKRPPRWAVAQAPVQADAAEVAHARLYGEA
jgi:hypothetical protein